LFRTGVGNYFSPRAALRLYLCLADRISVKNDNFKLEKNALHGPDVAHGLYVAPHGLEPCLYFHIACTVSK
jgi:hypothetical protein